MEDGSIADSQISASSEFSAALAAVNGRLNEGGWSVASGSVNVNQWIQVDLQAPTIVSGIITQGRDSTGQQWVTMFRVEYSDDGSTWQDVDGGTVNICD